MTLLPRMYSMTVTLSRTDGYDIDYVEHAAGFAVLNVAEKGGVVRLTELQSQGYLYLRP